MRGQRARTILLSGSTYISITFDSDTDNKDRRSFVIYSVACVEAEEKKNAITFFNRQPLVTVRIRIILPR